MVVSEAERVEPRILKIKKLHKDAVLPQHSSKEAAGYDLVSVHGAVV